MYLKNKYHRWYYNIIDIAKSRDSSEIGYIERHHIIPKSFGGSDDSENIVPLTAREHFICHLLLPKFTEGGHRAKMVHALWRMVNGKNHKNRYTPSSRIYEIAKLERSKQMKLLRGKDHPNFGKTHPERTAEIFTDEWKRKISESKKGKDPWNKGIPRTDAVKQAVSLANSGKEPWNKGKSWDQETRKAISESNSGKKKIHKDGVGKAIPIELLNEYLDNGWVLGLPNKRKESTTDCKCCGRIVTIRSFNRWHGDKCRGPC